MRRIYDRRQRTVELSSLLARDRHQSPFAYSPLIDLKALVQKRRYRNRIHVVVVVAAAADPHRHT